MRTEAEKMDIILQVPAVVLYQYDDITPEAPHHVEWRGIVASGKSIEAAKYQLGLQVGLQVGIES